MKRKKTLPRNGWEEKVTELGLIYPRLSDGTPYWDESAYYHFEMREILHIEKVTNELQKMCLEAGQHIIDKNLFAQFGIPDIAVPLIIHAWEKEPPAIYGRFDLAYDGKSEPKLLEYNADTPTSLLEASVIQWYWHQETKNGKDQFNSIHERLVEKWKELRKYMGHTIHFAHLDDLEDVMTVSYLRDTAEQAGFLTRAMLMDQIGWQEKGGYFVDPEDKRIDAMFKLYPWEWMVHENFFKNLVINHPITTWMEPIWKMLWSNKALLAVLWELYPDHPNLLPAYFDPSKLTGDYVKKPLMSREGANVSIIKNHAIVEERNGDYGEEGYVFQELYPLPNMDGNYPIIGSWVIDGLSAGMGIRESKNLITDNLSRFVPHTII